MRDAGYFKNKKITVVGLGRSGSACANLLYDLGAGVSITDNKNTDTQQKFLQRLNLAEFKIELGRHSKEFIKHKDLIVVSPGVTGDALPVIWAGQYKIPVISEIEFAWILCPATIIAVTGSNGKTTVTTLIANILKQAGRNAYILGNIGNPFSSEVAKIRETDYVSLEVSSFQLETISKFKPNISVILNFSPNHLDRYKDLDEYLKAKSRIFMNQDKADHLVLNYDDPVLRKLEGKTHAKVVYFSGNSKLNPNQAAAVTVSSILGIDKQRALKALAEFKGIQHRMEYIGKKNNIKFINDSKSTTPEATVWALKNIDAPVVLIAGGKDKGLDYKIILNSAAKKIRSVVLMGEAKEKIRDSLKQYLPIDFADNLEEATVKAYLSAKPKDTVLLSPMCSSFDMFLDFQERGNYFKEAVSRLIKNN